MPAIFTFLKRASLLAALVLVIGVLFEVAMRWYGGSEAAPVFQELFTQHPAIGHIPKPGARTRYVTPEFATDIAINAQGVRGRDIGPRQPHERRIVILGDSIVLSVQVPLEETFAAQLEARLNARHDGTTYRVINAGVQGYGPVEEYLFFEHVVRPLEPDLVLISVFAANDAIEAIDSAFKLDPNRTAAERARDEAMGTARRTTRRSMVLQNLRQRLDAVRGRLADAPAAQRPLMTYLTDPPPDVTRGLALSRDLFGRIAERARADGAKTALLLVPARFQLEDVDFAFLRAMVESYGGTIERDAGTTRFAEALQPLGLPTLDLLPVLKTDPDPASLFFRQNVHFTRRGHALVADTLERFLISERLVGNESPAAGATGSPQLP